MLALSQCPGVLSPGDNTAAIQAALDQKQPITWDCPANQVAGTDITKTLFLPPGFDITFTPAGLLNTDAVGFPALCAMNASGAIDGLKVHYTGVTNLATPGGGLWTDTTAKNYLVKAGMNPYTGRGAGTFWTSPTNTSSVLSIRGASTVSLPRLKMYVDPGVTAAGMIITAVALDAAYALGEPMGLGVTHGPLVYPSVSVSDFDFDGVMMGFVGKSGAKSTFKGGVSRRYGDLPDAACGWFAPPHLFYMHGQNEIREILDLGQYVGDPLARPASSGSCLSLKIELGYGTLVDGYFSRRLHGGMDILADGVSDLGGVIKNSFFLIDTSIITSDGKSAAWGVRFPSPAASYRPGAVKATLANRVDAPPPVLSLRDCIMHDLTLIQGYAG